MRYLWVIMQCVSERTVHSDIRKPSGASTKFILWLWLNWHEVFPYKIHFSEIKHHPHQLMHTPRHYNNPSTKQEFVKLQSRSKAFFQMTFMAHKCSTLELFQRFKDVNINTELKQKTEYWKRFYWLICSTFIGQQGAAATMCS